jgi:hypothetical protein
LTAADTNSIKSGISPHNGRIGGGNYNSAVAVHEFDNEVGNKLANYHDKVTKGFENSIMMRDMKIK